MQIMLKCVNTQLRMLIMWNCDQNCITYILCCDQIFSFFKNLYVLWKILFAPLAAAFLAAWAFGVNVIFVILACGLFGALRAIADAKRGKLQ